VQRQRHERIAPSASAPPSHQLSDDAFALGAPRLVASTSLVVRSSFVCTSLI
jgi:hypothetical protein